MKQELDDIKIYIESIDNDLCDLEDDIYGNEADDYVEVTCSNCGEEVYFESDLLEDDDVIEIVCPKCNEVVYINDGSFDFEPSIPQDNYDDSSKSDAPESKQ
jgi:DNA-directed RNA polymerase subunit RPC12/RpoP